MARASSLRRRGCPRLRRRRRSVTGSRGISRRCTSRARCRRGKAHNLEAKEIFRSLFGEHIGGHARCIAGAGAVGEQKHVDICCALGIDFEKVTLGIIDLDTVAGAFAGLSVVIAIGVVPCNFPRAGQREQGDCQGKNS